MDDVDVSELVAFREEAKASAATHGIKLTYLPFIVRAVTAALQEFPKLNASFDETGQAVVLKRDINCGHRCGYARWTAGARAEACGSNRHSSHGQTAERTD